MPCYIDDHLLVLDKPAGLLAVPGRSEPDCLAARAHARWPGARVVHRLDQATSGLIAFARSADAQRVLSAAFAGRQVHKRYVAVVHGRVGDAQGEITLPLAADWPNRPRQVVDAARGKPCVTRWWVLARGDGNTRLALEPVTGRTHQLRVHLQALGHPIVGDALYGPRGPSGPSGAEDPSGPRLLLHAAHLSLPHPHDGRPVAVESPVPF